jgi:hypothetical protein
MANKLYCKLLEIQKEIIGLGKDTQGNNYKYLSGTKLLEHIKPLMNKYGLILKQEVLSIDNERQDYTLNNGKNKSEILSKVIMRFTWIDCESGEKDENLFGANGQNDWEKGLGSALTYAERYFLLKYFHIQTDEDDIDNPDRKPHDKPQANQPQEPQSQSIEFHFMDFESGNVESISNVQMAMEAADCMQLNLEGNGYSDEFMNVMFAIDLMATGRESKIKTLSISEHNLKMLRYIAQNKNKFADILSTRKAKYVIS